MLDLTVVILTKNEKLHIERCLNCVNEFASKVFIVDCFSTDGTQEIARNLNAEVVEHEWPGNHAAQFNWALQNLMINTEWIMRLDADEYLLPNLITELRQKLPSLNKEINGIVFNRRHIFLDKWMKGGIYPVKMLRTFRRGHAICEQRLMDEHIVLTDGKTIDFENDFCDHNLNDISWFCKKHVDYALKEAAEMLDIEYNFSNPKQKDKGLSQQALSKRRKKYSYSRKPLFWRSAMYFIYRYIIRGGWKDGKEGFIFNFIQGWWYRTLVDAKIFEIKQRGNNNPSNIKRILEDNYNIKFEL